MAPVDLSQLRLNRVSCDPHELPSDPEDEDVDAYWDREADEIYIRVCAQKYLHRAPRASTEPCVSRTSRTASTSADRVTRWSAISASS